jgi:SAM-dependent methyltransferase
MKNKKSKEKKETTNSLLKLDLGCGTLKKEGYIGVDKFKFPEVDIVVDLGSETWPWEDNSVDDVNCYNFIEHLTNFNGKWERVHFFNELFRVLKKEAKANLAFPHWCSTRYYGDPTHCEPFSEMGFFYLNKKWREENAPHADKKYNPNGYSCDFESSWGYSVRQDLLEKDKEFVTHAVNTEKEAAQDIIAILSKNS